MSKIEKINIPWDVNCKICDENLNNYYICESCMNDILEGFPNKEKEILLKADKFFNSIGYGDLENFIQSCEYLKIIILNKDDFKCINDLNKEIKELKEKLQLLQVK